MSEVSEEPLAGIYTVLEAVIVWRQSCCEGNMARWDKSVCDGNQIVRGGVAGTQFIQPKALLPRLALACRLRTVPYKVLGLWPFEQQWDGPMILRSLTQPRCLKAGSLLIRSCTCYALRLGTHCTRCPKQETHLVKGEAHHPRKRKQSAPKFLWT
eukprot:38329-Amphidinium_carterae.1